MSETQEHSAIYTLLKRLGLCHYADNFKQRQVSRVIALRQLSPEVFEEIVPNREDREKIMAAVSTQRGASAKNQWGNRGNSDWAAHHEDVYQPSTAPHSGGAHSFHQEGGRGRGNYRGRGNRNDSDENDRNNRSGNGKRPYAPRPCRMFFTEKGCPFGEKCRYSHEDPGAAGGVPPSCGAVMEHYQMLKDYDRFSEEITVPAHRVRYLIGVHGSKMKEINEKYKVRNEPFNISHMTEGNISFRIFGSTAESVEAAKNEIAIVAGLVKDDKMKHRFQHVVNELELNTNAARVLCAANTYNKDKSFHLSDSILRSIISTFRFLPRQQIEHFYIQTGISDKEKLEMLSRLVAQMNGVQAIIFCEAKRVQAMSAGGFRISRCMNHVKPQFVYPAMPKEERMEALEEFKKGTPNEHGILQRLLVTTSDFAKLARKSDIPFVNFVVHFSPPKSEEFYALQSNVVGRCGAVGASILCLAEGKTDEYFKELEKSIQFKPLTQSEEFGETAVRFKYDTVNEPLTPEGAIPPSNWRETMGESKK